MIVDAPGTNGSTTQRFFFRRGAIFWDETLKKFEIGFGSTKNSPNQFSNLKNDKTLQINFQIQNTINLGKNNSRTFSLYPILKYLRPHRISVLLLHTTLTVRTTVLSLSYPTAAPAYIKDTSIISFSFYSLFSIIRIFPTYHITIFYFITIIF